MGDFTEKRRSPFRVILLSFLSIGAGFTYNGFLLKGILVTVGFIVIDIICTLAGVYYTFTGAMFTYLGLFLLGIYFIVYLAIIARRRKTIQLRSYNRWFIYLAFIIIPIAVSEYLDRNSGLESRSAATGSMSPTITEDDRFLLDRNYYHEHDLHVGDVVAFQYPIDPKKLMLKRCIAVAGQTVELRDGYPFVDGARSLPQVPWSRSGLPITSKDYKDPTIVPSGAGNKDNYGPVIVPQGKFFVLGQTIDNSLDSRDFGFIDETAIEGRALYVCWSWDFSRIGRTIE